MMFIVEWLKPQSADIASWIFLSFFRFDFLFPSQWHFSVLYYTRNIQFSCYSRLSLPLNKYRSISLSSSLTHAKNMTLASNTEAENIDWELNVMRSDKERFIIVPGDRMKSDQIVYVTIHPEIIHLVRWFPFSSLSMFSAGCCYCGEYHCHRSYREL